MMLVSMYHSNYTLTKKTLTTAKEILIDEAESERRAISKVLDESAPETCDCNDISSTQPNFLLSVSHFTFEPRIVFSSY